VWQAALGERTRQRDGVAGGNHDGRDFVRPVTLEHQERNAAADAHGLGSLAARAGNVGRVHAPVLSTDDHDGLASERQRPLDDALQETRIAGRRSRWHRNEKREADDDRDQPQRGDHMAPPPVCAHVQSIRQIGPMK
jgi:hypothetical protein